MNTKSPPILCHSNNKINDLLCDWKNCPFFTHIKQGMIFSEN